MRGISASAWNETNQKRAETLKPRTKTDVTAKTR